MNATYVPSVNDIHDGYVELTLHVDGLANCSDVEDSMTLSIEGMVEVEAGSDAAICQTDNYPIMESVASNYASLLWTTTGTGTFTSSSVLHPVYTPGANESGVVTMTLTGYGLGPCPDVSDSFALTIYDAADVDAGADALICEGSDYVLSTASASGYSSLLWSTSGTGTFDDATLVHATYTPSPNDILDGYVTLTLTGQGIGSCPAGVDAMTLSISRQAEVSAGDDAEICEGSTYTLASASADHATGLLWSTSGTGTFDDATILHPTYTPGAGEVGQVVLTLTATSVVGCFGDQLQHGPLEYQRNGNV